MKKKWTIKSYDKDIAHKLWDELGNPHYSIAQLLAQRDLSSFEQAKKYFNPELNHLHDPFLMKDMEQAVFRIMQAVEKQEKIMIYGDYDVDGTTAVALVFLFLKTHFQDLELHTYIPNRFEEGYGISYKGIDQAENLGCSLIICLDCGIRSIEHVAYAQEKNIDFIICDHHFPGDELPDAYAILNPKQNDCPYPFKELSGCGVGFKLITAIAEKQAIPFSSLHAYLDLLALSIAADLVPLVDENRVLAFWGLKKINEDPCLAIRTIRDVTAFKNNYTITDLGFRIAPLINAAGRMNEALLAVDLFIESEGQRSKEIAESLLAFNVSRKKLDTEILKDTLRIIEQDEDFNHKKSIVLSHDTWHKGIIGIVASRLIEKYYKPTVILTKTEGVYTGSARSVYGFNIHAALEHCGHLLDNFGGHFFAAGMSLPEGNRQEFEKEFEKFVSGNIGEESLFPIIDIDAELKFNDINDRFFNTIQRFEPCGQNNPKPVFKSKKVYDFNGGSKILKDKHVKFLLTQDGQLSIGGIGFNLAEKYKECIDESDCFDIVYTLEKNTWGGKSYIQLHVVDIKVHEEYQDDENECLPIQEIEQNSSYFLENK